jgi:serine O-acetyltransferase
VSKKRIGSFRQLRAVLSEDYAVHGRDPSSPGFRTLAVYRFGVWVHDLRNRSLRWPLRRLYRLLFVRMRRSYGIELHYTVRVGRRLRLAHQNGIAIHHYARIGDDCVIRQNVTIGATGDAARPGVPIIGSRVQIGAGAAVIGKVRIGDDVLIGPNTVVREDVPDACSVQPPVARLRRRGIAGRKPDEAAAGAGLVAARDGGVRLVSGG